MSKENFIFSVLTYNHELYIIEHLESIKYLIENFGSGYNFKIIIADDGSRDQTVLLANQWLLAHGDLFVDVTVLADGLNSGTCYNYTRLWPLINGDLFKITAGDDVYSCTDIFKEVEKLKHNDFFSGLPLLLVDGKIRESRSTIFHILATNIVYRRTKFIERIRGVSSINTPNLFYSNKFLKDQELCDFIKSYRVTEDFPMMVKIASSYENISFSQSNEVYIYYRRTSGSNYLVRCSDFDLDKLQAFNYMLTKETKWLARAILKNRIFCYKLDNTVAKKILNIGYYIYLLKITINFFPIFKSFKKSNTGTSNHQSHYDLIAKRSEKFLKTIDYSIPK